MSVRSWLSSVVVTIAALAVTGTVAQAADSAKADTPYQVAQVNIQFGGGTKSVVKELRRQGYSEIQITKSGFSSVRAQACYEGGRYAIKYKRFTGETRRVGKIGECRPALSEAQIVRKLKRDGFRRVTIYASDLDLSKIIACKAGRRFRMELNAYGDILVQDEVGSCIDELNVSEVRQRLRDQGYNRIKFIREGERRFVFEACQGRRLVRLRVRKDGAIARKRRVGDCNPPITLRQLPGLMESNGYDRVVLVDKKLPVYAAEGCKNSNLHLVKFNRFGDILSSDKTGECDPPLNEKQIFALVRQGGGYRIKVDIDKNDNFVVSSCHKNRVYRSRFDKYGKLFDERRVGKCPPAPRLPEILARYRDQDRGLSDVRAFVIACREKNGARIRFELDSYGDLVERVRIGNCK